MEVPGLESEVYFGDAEAPPPDWRAVLSEDEPDPEDDPENAATATAMLGFDPVSLWEESAEEVDAEPQTKSLENHKFGCLLLPLAEPDAKEVTDWIIENVHDEHLAPDGRCLRSHVTVLYGFKDCDEEQLHRIESILTRHGPVEAKFGDAVSAFPEGKDGVPLKVDLISPQFEALNAVLREEFFDQVEITHPDFQPHLTLAYLLPGTEKFYLDAKPPFLGKKLSLGMAEFSSPDKVRTQIRLSWLPMLKHIDADDRVIKDNPMPICSPRTFISSPRCWPVTPNRPSRPLPTTRSARIAAVKASSCWLLLRPIFSSSRRTSPISAMLWPRSFLRTASTTASI